MIDGVLGWSSADLIKLSKADALFYWGRAEEAEGIFRGFVQPSRGVARRLAGCEGLGLALLALGRYSESEQAFQAAAALWPGRSVAYSGMSEVRLRQGVEPFQALAFAERALRKHRHGSERFFSARLASIRGNQGWALALLGRASESQQAIESGAVETDPKNRPELAGFHWRAGMAMVAMENPSTAADHFRRASELDPEGYYGGLARRQLCQQGL